MNKHEKNIKLQPNEFEAALSCNPIKNTLKSIHVYYNK